MTAYFKQKTKEELIELINSSSTFSDLMKHLGYTSNRGNSSILFKKYLDMLEIDYSKFSIRNSKSYSHPKYTIDNLLVKDSTYSNQTSLKRRILSNNLLPLECNICKIKDWQGRPLILQLDHINGNNRDNRLDNLRLLCPNCHSQTSTFCRRKIVI